MSTGQDLYRFRCKLKELGMDRLCTSKACKQDNLTEPEMES